MWLLILWRELLSAVKKNEVSFAICAHLRTIFKSFRLQLYFSLQGVFDLIIAFIESELPMIALQ